MKNIHNNTELNKENIALTMFNGPVTNEKPAATKQYSLEGLSELFRVPKKGKKDGPYFVRGECNGNRCDANMVSAQVIVIDADKGAEGRPCPPVDLVIDALEVFGWEYILYTSYSHTPTKPRYRIILRPSRLLSAEEITPVYLHVLHALTGTGVHIKISDESKVFSQPWFFPRYSTNEQQKNFQFASGGTEPVDIDPIIVNQKTTAIIQNEHPGLDIEETIRAIVSGEVFHPKLLALAAHLIGTGMAPATAVKHLQAIMQQCKNKDQRWHDRYEQIDKLVSTASAKFAVEDAQNDTEIKTPDWPILSEKALPGIAGEFVQLATENSEADPAAVLVTFLTRFGVEVGVGPHMWIGDTAHRCIVASVIVGDSSKARKGTSGKPVKRLFSSGPMSDFTPARAEAGPFSTGEGIIYMIRDEVKRFNEKEQQWIVTDPGIEDKRLFILDEEFGNFMSCAKRDGSILSMIIRQMWDSGTLAPIIKNNRTIATGGHVGWVSHITLYELNTRLDESEAFNGFANRILWVCAKRQQLVPWPEPMEESRVHVIQSELFRIITSLQDEVVIRPDSATKQAWAGQHYQYLTRARPGLLGAVTNRAEAQTLRLAMIYCLLDGKTIIELPHLEAALAFWDYCEQSAKFIFHGKSQDTVARKILDALQDGPKTGTEIHRLFASHTTKGRLETALTELLASGRIFKTQNKTAGRPVTFYEKQHTPGVKSVISVKSPDLPQGQGLNTLNTLNTLRGNKKNGLNCEGHKHINPSVSCTPEQLKEGEI